MRRVMQTWLLILLSLVSAELVADAIPKSDFISTAFGRDQPEQGMLWLTEELQDEAIGILGHRYGALRLRYWFAGERSAWILDEIGKELPITVGVVITGGEVEQVQVLAFRESRGGEVRYPFFTGQFRGAALDGSRQLDRSIDGITGATLSVRAVKAVVRFALRLDAVRTRDAASAIALQD